MKNRSKEEKTKKKSKGYVFRLGQELEVDEAIEAMESGDLNRMLKAVSVKTNPIDRHFLLQTIVGHTYSKRKDPEMRKICKEIGEKHLSEFKDLETPLKHEFDGELPRVSTFQELSTVYTEDGNYDRAIEICKMALSYDLHDRTQGGFDARIKRIEKKRNSKQ